MNYDVAIIGAGIAGNVAALELSKYKDIKVIIIEKGEKVVSNLLPETLYLNSDIESFLESIDILDNINTYIYSNNIEVCITDLLKINILNNSKTNTPFIGKCKLINDLRNKLLTKKISSLWNTEVIEIKDAKNIFKIRTNNNEEIYANYIVDASGKSMTSKNILGFEDSRLSLPGGVVFTHINSNFDQITIYPVDKEYFVIVPISNNRSSLILTLKNVDPPLNQQNEIIFDKYLNKCPSLKNKIQGHSKLMPLISIKNEVVKSKLKCKNGLFLIGDAGEKNLPYEYKGMNIAFQTAKLVAKIIGEDNPKSDLQDNLYTKRFNEIIKKNKVEYNLHNEVIANISNDPHLPFLIKSLLGNEGVSRN